MKWNIPALIIAGLLLVTSCSDQKTKSLQAIAIQEKALNALPRDQEIPGEEQQRLTTALIDQYETYMETWPEDTVVGRFAFETRILLETLGKYEEAIKIYDQVWKQHPEHRFAAPAQYRTGFICEKVLKDYSEAKERYTEFAEMHPGHPLAKNMELQLLYIGNDEALLNSILSGDTIQDPQP